MTMTNLLPRLREALPTAADGPDHRTYCTVLGEDLRAAVEALSGQGWTTLTWSEDKCEACGKTVMVKLAGEPSP